MKKLNILFVLLFCVFTMFSQKNIEFKASNFKHDKKGFKEAVKSLKAGDKSYLVRDFHLALDFFKKANQVNPSNDDLNYKIGDCYYNVGNKANSAKYFEKAYEINPEISDDILFKIANSYHSNLMFDKAIYYYKKYKNKFDPKKVKKLDDFKRERVQRIEKYIKECNYGKEHVKNENKRIFIDNLGDKINGKFKEYSPFITADESKMFFTSRRPETTGGQREPDGDYREDIYISERLNGKWSIARQMPKSINTKDNDATAGLSYDGSIIFIYNSKGGDGDVTMAELVGEEWERLDKFKKINSKHHETSTAITTDNKTLYFVSNRPNDGDNKSLGGYDIFSSYKDEKGKWTEPVSLGAPINDEYDQRSVFLHPNNKAMYFSSTGHNSMGGYDVFVSHLGKNGKWSEPINMGFPINTSDDDLFFVMAASGKRGYYSSEKIDGYGGQDIYVITFLGAEKTALLSNEDNMLAAMEMTMEEEPIIAETEEISTSRLTIFKGTVKDAVNKKPLEASILIVDNVTSDTINVLKSNSATGKFMCTLPSGVNYGIAVSSGEYTPHSENFNIPATDGYQEVEKDILLNKYKVGTKFVLRNVFFDFDKSTIRPESSAELDRLTKIMSDYPKMKIELSGHTDSKGSDVYNQKLSQRRAKAVVDYLVSKKGIALDRLKYKGYGEVQPIATNETDEGRQLNRRTEVKILSL